MPAGTPDRPLTILQLATRADSARLVSHMADMAIRTRLRQLPRTLSQLGGSVSPAPGPPGPARLDPAPCRTWATPVTGAGAVARKRAPHSCRRRTQNVPLEGWQSPRSCPPSERSRVRQVAPAARRQIDAAQSARARRPAGAPAALCSARGRGAASGGGPNAGSSLSAQLCVV